MDGRSDYGGQSGHDEGVPQPRFSSFHGSRIPRHSGRGTPTPRRASAPTGRRTSTGYPTWQPWQGDTGEPPVPGPSTPATAPPPQRPVTSTPASHSWAPKGTPSRAPAEEIPAGPRTGSLGEKRRQSGGNPSDRAAEKMPDRGASSSPAETVAALLDELQGTQDCMARMEALLAQVVPDYHRRLDSPVQPVPVDEPSRDYEGNPGEDDEPEQDEPGIPEEDAVGYSADGDGEFEEPVRRRSHRENTPRAEDTGENQRAAPPRGAENHTPRLSRSERRRAREPTREPDIPSEDEDDEPGPYRWGGPVDQPHRRSGREELYRPAFTVPTDHRRVSIATQRELPPHIVM
ncbi:hypothetical protein FS749_002377 [Ceratobasidium sp. UAMH 11750]|nr:hypothetical protein FS749_002377 [Ceratobasidium sp. UAMH 11750]